LRRPRPPPELAHGHRRLAGAVDEQALGLHGGGSLQGGVDHVGDSRAPSRSRSSGSTAAAPYRTASITSWIAASSSGSSVSGDATAVRHASRAVTPLAIRRAAAQSSRVLGTSRSPQSPS